MRVLHSQFSILGREIGNMFIPMLLKVIPAAIAVVKVLNLVVRAIAKMLGFTLPDLNWDSVNTGAGAVGDLQDNLDGATKSAKALKRQLAGFDELNNLTSPTPSSGGGGAGGAGGGAGFELDLPDYDMLDGFNKGIDDLTDKIKKLLGISEDGFGNISWRWKDMDGRIKAVIATIGALIAIKGLLKLANMIRVLGDAFVYVRALASKFFGVLVGGKATGSVSILTKLSSAFNSVASALGVSAGGLALIIAGIAAVVTTFVYAYKNNEKFRQSVKDLGKAFSNLVNTLRDKLQPVIEALQPLFDMFIKNFKSGAKDLLKIGYELIKLGLEQVIDGITASLTIMNQILQGDFSGALQTFLDMLSNGWNNATDSMKEILPSMENLANGIKDSWGKVFQTISGLFTNLASWFYTTVITPIINFFTEIWNKVTEIFSSIWQNITDTFTGIVSFFDSNVSTPIANIFRTLWSAITDIFSKAFNWFDEKVIQPIVSVFKPLITKIGEIFSTIWQIIKALFGVAAKWFDDNVIQPIVEIFKAFWQTTKDITQGIWNTVVEIIGKIAKWVYENIIKPITQYASDLFNAIKKVIENIWNTTTQIIGKIANWVNNNVIKPITSGFEIIYTTVSRVVTNVWNSITRTFGGIASWINNNVVQPIGDFFWNTWERVASSISGIIRGAVNAALSGVERVVNFFINGLNRVVGVVNALPGVNIGYVNPLYLPRFAKGGFPQAGQLFMAREAGAELVGQIGNRTAVANNDQIIAGIQQGVYNAMINAQAEQYQQPQIINIGNRQVYKSFSSGLRTENNRLGTSVVRV